MSTHSLAQYCGIRTLDALIDGNPSTLLVYLLGETLVGKVKLERTNRAVANFYSLFVNADFRRQRVATSLLEACEVLACEAGCEAIACEVKKTNTDALLFYRRLGFVVCFEFNDGSLLVTKGLASTQPIAEEAK